MSGWPLAVGYASKGFIAGDRTAGVNIHGIGRVLCVGAVANEQA